MCVEFLNLQSSSCFWPLLIPSWSSWLSILLSASGTPGPGLGDLETAPPRDPAEDGAEASRLPSVDSQYRKLTRSTRHVKTCHRMCFYQSSILLITLYGTDSSRPYQSGCPACIVTCSVLQTFHYSNSNTVYIMLAYACQPIIKVPPFFLGG